MKLIDHYPETLRDIHDKIDSLLLDLELPEAFCGDVALQVTEWIRKQWGGRTLTRIWWQPLAQAETDPHQADLINIPADPVRTLRGQELRATVWAIIVLVPPFSKGQAGGPCHLATQIAATVEGEWLQAPIYIPKAPEVDRAIRDQDIWRRFRWLGNIDQVIERHGLAQSQLYAIKRRVQQERDTREQPPLPGLS